MGNRKIRISFLVIFLSFIITIPSIYLLNIFGKELNKAIDKKDCIEIEDVDISSNIVKGNISRQGLESSIAAEEVEQYIRQDEKKSPIKDGKKYVFLTFDDGPSDTVSPKILDILKEENVKATFFMVGSKIEGSENNKRMLKQIYNEGHAIGHHTYYHDYTKIYPENSIDVEEFMDEINKTNNIFKSVIGNDFESKIVRLPEGEATRKDCNDKNLPKLLDEFKKEGIRSIDWTSLCGDAESIMNNEKQMLSLVKETSSNKEKVVVLMHDTYGKEKTAEILPDIIKYFKEQGYEFKTIRE